MSKNHIIVSCSIIILALIIAGLFWIHFHNAPTFSTIIASSTSESPVGIVVSSTPNSQAMPSPCSSDTSQLAYIPPLPTDLVWIISTSSIATHSANWQAATSSGETNGIIFRDALENPNIPLQGQAWTAVSSSNAINNDYPGYLRTLTGLGWSTQVDIGGGNILNGIGADGYNGGEVGVIKIENENFREIIIEHLNSGVLNMFVSDIVPIDQIVAAYQTKCTSSTVLSVLSASSQTSSNTSSSIY